MEYSPTRVDRDIWALNGATVLKIHHVEDEYIDIVTDKGVFGIDYEPDIGEVKEFYSGDLLDELVGKKILKAHSKKTDTEHPNECIRWVYLTLKTKDKSYELKWKCEDHNYFLDIEFFQIIAFDRYAGKEKIYKDSNEMYAFILDEREKERKRIADMPPRRHSFVTSC